MCESTIYARDSRTSLPAVFNCQRLIASQLEASIRTLSSLIVPM